MNRRRGNDFRAVLYTNNKLGNKRRKQSTYIPNWIRGRSCSICGKSIRDTKYKLCTSCAEFIQQQKVEQ